VVRQVVSADDKQSVNQVRGVISGDRHLSAEALERNARRVAAAMHDLGVWQGDRVALLMRNDLAYFEATRGAACLGASTVPLNWHLTADEIEHVLDDCNPKVLVAHADLLDESILAVCSDVEVVAVNTPPEIASAYGISAEKAAVPGGLPEWESWFGAYSAWIEQPRAIVDPMFYTSGTTGKPKGVRRARVPPELSAASVQRTARAFGLDRSPLRAVMTGPLYHSAPNAYGMRIVGGGGLLVLQPRFNALELLQLVERHRISHLHMVPTMFVRLLALDEADRKRFDLSGLEFVCHGAAPCPADVKRAIIDWWGPVVHEYYAMTETGIIATSNSADWLAHPGTVGSAADGVELRILDSAGDSLPPGEPGEICVRTALTSFVSYHRASEKTAAMRRGDFVATGDVGYLDEEGFLYISDRISDMVISGGVNIYPAEIESVLMGIDQVSDCAVLGVPDPEFGEKLIAFVIGDEGLDENAVKDYLSDKLARYKLPREIRFARELPREDSGKIKKRLLREAYLKGGLPDRDAAVGLG
jgi:long-chain acyl-CoA synthetase